MVQRTLFVGPTAEAPEDLYSLVTRGVVVRERGRLMLHRHACATTNTYFGRFPATYWQRWTSAPAVTIEFVVTGDGIVRIMASDATGGPRTVVVREVVNAHAETVRLSVRLDRFVDGGGLWFEMETDEGELTVERVRWSVGRLRSRRPTAVVICTYNRVQDCVATLGTLVGDREVFADLDSVYVVDQGSDTLDAYGEFEALRREMGATLRYVRQRNLGGAGGFTRGMYEAMRDHAPEGVNLLLMDDDIRLEPETVLRLRGLADRADQSVLVGAQMLNLLHPNRLHVGAETADLAILRAGQPVEGAMTNADLTDREDLTKAEQHPRVDAVYNAWWTCLIPSEVVETIGYPLPLFFQWDDIEFGLRAREHGFPTVTLAGAGVWHADFAWKNWDDWSRYFSFRNALITSALHSDFDRRSIVGYLAGQLVDALVSMRYGLADLMLRAVQDFLRGPDVLADAGAETSAGVRKAWCDHPETQNYPASAVPGVPNTAMSMTAAAGTPSMMRAVLVKRLLRQLLRRPGGIAAVSSADAHWWHVSLFDTAVVTDPSQEGVRVRQLDLDQAGVLARRGAVLLGRLWREGRAARDEWRRRLPELSGRETWERHIVSR
ncbi:glycosyltransferase [Modestobacter marinus]|uniref:glycosyltransferase n=1 Tax=Modestobacter marinus TaxID=477641 RepID=UPI001C98C4E3|nr:glycosyltransferase [Modestobacter marinus]